MVTEATVTDERLTTHRSTGVGGISRHQQMCLSVWSHIKIAHSSHHSTTGDISVYNEDKVSSVQGQGHQEWAQPEQGRHIKLNYQSALNIEMSRTSHHPIYDYQLDWTIYLLTQILCKLVIKTWQSNHNISVTFRHRCHRIKHRNRYWIFLLYRKL